MAEDDPTGMKHAQAREAGAVKARAQAAGRWMRDRVPMSKWKRDRLDREAAEKAGKEEEARIKAKKRLETEAGRTETAIDTTSAEGGGFPLFRNALHDAIRRGQSRAAGTTDMTIREVVCSDAFIQAIEGVMIRTPIEEVEVEYQKQMMRIRGNLASQLKKAKENSEYTISKLSTHDMDIIIHTMIGHAPLWASAPWPANLLKPPEAFLRFLESVALREKPGGEGEFIGGVLKNMAAMRTITGATDKHAPREIVDVAYINSFLSRKSAEPVERAVADFAQSVQQILETPCTEIHPGTGMPGHGLVPKLTEGLQAKVDAVNAAKQVLDSAKAAHDSAAAIADGAKKELDKVADYKRRADARRDKISDADYQKIERALEAETAKYEAAQAEAEKGAVPLARATEAYNEAVFEARAYKREMEAKIEGTKREAIDLFRPELKGDINPERVADAMAPRLVNQHVADLVDQAENTLVKWKEYGRLANMEFEAFVERTDELLDRKDALSKVKEKFVDKVATTISEKDLVALERDISALRDEVAGSTLPDELKAPLVAVMEPLSNMGYPREAIEKKVEAVYLEQNVLLVQQMIDSAEVPEETKAEMRKALGKVKKKGAGEDFSAQMTIIRKAHAQPLRKAAHKAVEKMTKPKFDSPIGITDQQWAKAYEVWTASSTDLEGVPVKGESWWARKMNWFSRRLSVFSDESVYRVLGRLLYGSVKNNLHDLYPPNWFQPTYDKRLDNGQKIKSKYWVRLFRGATGLFVKVWLVGSLYQYYTSPGGFVDHFIYDARGGQHWYNKARWPFEWWTQVERPRQVRIVVDHHPDIYERLPDRSYTPDSFYRSQYGVGTRRVEGEADDSGKSARLEWLRGHPEVLRYLQERTLTDDRQLPMRLDSWRTLEVTPQSASTSTRQIPESCERMGLRTIETVMNYRYSTNREGWRADSPVECLIEMQRTPIADGLLLNPVQSDRFVKILMDQERGGLRVNYEYLARIDSRMRWAGESFLISPREHTIIRDYRVTERDNIQFIMTQGTRATDVIGPMTRRADARDFVPERSRDAFVTIWREEIVRARAGSNPVQEEIPEDVMGSSLQAALTRGRTAAVQVSDSSVPERERRVVVDVTAEYERRQILLPFEPLELQTDTAKDILVAQEDIRNLVRQFLPSSSTHSINVGRADEFIQVLAQHRMRGGQVAEFSPFGGAPGARVAWAVSMDLIRPREVFSPATGRDAQTGQPIPSAAQAAQDLGPQAERFFSTPNAQTLRDYIDGMIVRLQNDRTGGRVIQTALSSRFGGNEDAMRRAVRTEVFRFLNSTAAPEVQQRGQWGITVSGSGEAMQVTVNDRTRFVRQLETHLLNFLNRRQ